MHWFLHYALNEVNTDILKSASTVVLCRDEREGQPAVCFRAANGEPTPVCLGLLRTAAAKQARSVIRRMPTMHTG